MVRSTNEPHISLQSCISANFELGSKVPSIVSIAIAPWISCQRSGRLAQDSQPSSLRAFLRLEPELKFGSSILCIILSYLVEIKNYVEPLGTMNLRFPYSVWEPAGLQFCSQIVESILLFQTFGHQSRIKKHP